MRYWRLRPVKVFLPISGNINIFEGSYIRLTNVVLIMLFIVIKSWFISNINLPHILMT